MAIGFFGFAYFAISESQSTQLAAYPFMAAFGVGVTWQIHRTHGFRGTRQAGVVITAALMFLFGHFDTYEYRWSDGDFSFNDTYKTWGGQHVYRSIFDYSKDDASGVRWRSTSGGMAGTGKPHGKWVTVYYNPEFKITTQFYWYGEEISEGEWHLRNR